MIFVKHSSGKILPVRIDLDSTLANLYSNLQEQYPQYFASEFDLQFRGVLLSNNFSKTLADSKICQSQMLTVTTRLEDTASSGKTDASFSSSRSTGSGLSSTDGQHPPYDGGPQAQPRDSEDSRPSSKLNGTNGSDAHISVEIASDQARIALCEKSSIEVPIKRADGHGHASEKGPTSHTAPSGAAAENAPAQRKDDQAGWLFPPQEFLVC
jgi:hypothetical protein